jgi:hypothetical protein
MTTKTFTYDQFTYTNKLLTIEASMAGFSPGYHPDSIRVIGRTGAIVDYDFSGTSSAGGEVISWDYRPSAASLLAVPASKGTEVRVFNT